MKEESVVGKPKRVKPPKRQGFQKTYIGYYGFEEGMHLPLIEDARISCKLYNHAVVECEKRLGLDKPESISSLSLNYWLPDLIKSNPEFQPYLTEQMLRRVLVEVSGSFASYFQLRKNGDTAARRPKVKPDGHLFAISLTGIKRVNDNLAMSSRKGEKIIIPLNDWLRKKLSGVSHEKGKDGIRSDGEFSDITLIWRVNPDVKPEDYEKGESGNWQVSVAVKYPLPIVQKSNDCKVRSVDLGAGDIAVSEFYDVGVEAGVEQTINYLIPARRPDKYWQEKIESVEKRAKNCNKGSRAWHRRMKARRHMHNKSGNQKLDYQKKLAHQLTSNTDVLIVGKGWTRLGLAKSSGTADQHRGAQNTGYLFRLLMLLKNKCKERGVKFVELDDPKRRGELEDPLSKVNASQGMLADYLSKNQQ